TVHTPHLNPFPTRRSSDLFVIAVSDYRGQDGTGPGARLLGLQRASQAHRPSGTADAGTPCRPPTMLDQDASGGDRPLFRTTAPRSEEHTSELQSRVDLVCR